MSFRFIYSFMCNLSCRKRKTRKVQRNCDVVVGLHTSTKVWGAETEIRQGGGRLNVAGRRRNITAGPYLKEYQISMSDRHDSGTNNPAYAGVHRASMHTTDLQALCLEARLGVEVVGSLDVRRRGWFCSRTVLLIPPFTSICSRASSLLLSEASPPDFRPSFSSPC
jgi:hypothetical protein